MPLSKKLLSVSVEEKYAKLFPSSTSTRSLNIQHLIALTTYIKFLEREDGWTDMKRIELDIPNCLGFFLYARGYFMCLTTTYEYIDHSFDLSESDSYIQYYDKIKIFKAETEKAL